MLPRCCLRLCLLGVLLTAPGDTALAQEQPVVPSRQEVLDLLAREPITKGSWKAWKPRLLSWFDDRSRQTDPAWDAARAFAHEQADDQDKLPPELADDALVWYFVGGWHLHNAGKAEQLATALNRGERALRHSLKLDPRQAWAHRNLALAILWQEQSQPNPDAARLTEAEQELTEASRLNPNLPLSAAQGQLAFVRRDFSRAATWFERACQDDKENQGLAQIFASSLIYSNRPRSGGAQKIAQLVERFPQDGVLASLHGAALAQDGDGRAGLRELERARSLGTDPARVLHPQDVAAIERFGATTWVEHSLWIMLYFALCYLGVMALMALMGLILATRTRGSAALKIFGVRPDELVIAGQAPRSGHESMLARFYLLALMLGLVLFYLAIPFVLAGLLGVTGTLVYLTIVFMGAHRFAFYAIGFIVIIGGGMIVAVFKSLFTRPAQGSYGVSKTEEQCPQLHRLLREVAEKVDTAAVHDVYLAPGAGIGVHQEGRGPFGLFGVKRRVLTLGLSTMRFLTAGELKAILAHEYAHFSHKDTFYSRFIYQVSMSIEHALWGMGQAGGWVNYVNPFYWLLWLYYRSYTLLSAGFSRSREYLADRMAAILYGSDVFASALTKVTTDGQLFEMSIYDHIHRLLDQQQAFVNMYTAFQDFRDVQIPAHEREEFYQKLLDEKASLFASHPTFGERVQAIQPLPFAEQRDDRPAVQLFEDAEAIEQELTLFLTDQMAAWRELLALMAAQQQHG